MGTVTRSSVCVCVWGGVRENGERTLFAAAAQQLDRSHGSLAQGC